MISKVKKIDQETGQVDYVFEYAPFNRGFDESLSGTPNINAFQMNNADYALVTVLHVNETGINSQDESGILNTITSGDTLKFSAMNSPERSITFKATGVSVGGDIPVVYVSDGGETPFIDDESFGIEIFKGASTGVATLNTEYIHDVATGDADPGAGKSRIDNLEYTLAAFLYIDNVDDNSFPTSVLLETLEFGDFIYQKQLSDPDRSVVFKVTGTPTDGTGYWKVPVSHEVSGSGGNLEDTERIGIVFFRSGDSSKTKIITGTTHLLADNDDEFRLLFTNAADILVTVNTGLENAFHVSTFEQGGAGEISFGGTATINNPDGFADPKTEKQHVEVSLKGKGSDIYTLNGRLKP